VRATADLEHLRPSVEDQLRAELRARARGAGLPADVGIEIQPSFGRPDGHLAMIAAQRRADLLVLGAHQRAGLDRLWHGSVSRGVLHGARQNVVTVPTSVAEERRTSTAPYRQVVCATDFSPEGDAAVPHAFAIAFPGTTVHLVHVLPESHEVPLPGRAPHDVPDANAKLATLVPKDAAARGVEVVLHAMHGSAPDRILALATTTGADVVCLGIRSPAGAEEPLGIVSRAVAARAACPILLVRRPA
jgi:nucleotide-binding universal stress UspA family protein